MLDTGRQSMYTVISRSLDCLDNLDKLDILELDFNSLDISNIDWIDYYNNYTVRDELDILTMEQEKGLDDLFN